ncbi:cilia- and flagella-associated protein 57-like [Argonauta hians]
MKTFKASKEGNEITAMNVNHKLVYGAVAVKADVPTINIFELYTRRKKKGITHPESLPGHIIDLAFSYDSRYMLAMCNDPARTLFYWLWEKSKLIIATKLAGPQITETINGIFFNIQDNVQLYIYGNKLLKMIRLSDGKLRLFSFPKIKPENFTCYAWDVNKQLLIGTNTGKVLLLEGTDLIAELYIFQYLDIPNEAAIKHGITALISYSKGFITACGTKYVQIFETISDRGDFIFVRNITLPSDVLDNSVLCNQVIRYMAINQSEDVLVISTDMKQIYSSLINPPETKYAKQTIKFGILVYPFHYKPITGCSVGLWKPFIATSSLDGSIKLWNYEKFTLEFSKDFTEEIYSISMHPTAFFLLAGFSDKLRIMYILRDDLKPFMDFNIRECIHCNFSHGGHMFAAVNENFIHVYSSITFERIANLKGHNGRVRSTAWYLDDNNLISCGLDGAVYDWELSTGKRIGQCVLKSTAYKDVVVNSETKNFYAVGSDHSMKEIYESDILRTFSSGDFIFTSIAMSSTNSMLFVGTSNGILRCFEYPIASQIKWVDYPLHSGEVSNLCFTPDDRFLISTSNDASISILKVVELDSWDLSRNNHYCPNIIIPESLWEDKLCYEIELKTRTSELVMENKYKMHLNDMSHHDNVRNTNEDFSAQIDTLTDKNIILQHLNKEQEIKYEAELCKLRSQNGIEIQVVESVNDKKLIENFDKYKDLQNMIASHLSNHATLMVEQKEKRELALNKVKQQYDKRMTILNNKLKDIQEELSMRKIEHDEILGQSEEDADLEIEHLKNYYKRELRNEEITFAKIQEENNILKKKLKSYPKELKESKEECKKYKLEIKRINTVIQLLDRDKLHLKVELLTKDQLDTNEERHSYEMKMKNHALNALKCELEDDKMFALREQIQRTGLEITDMKAQIKVMQSKLENLTKQFIIIDQTTAETKEKLKVTTEELAKERTQLRRKTALMERFLADLNDCSSFIQDPVRLKNSIKALYIKYIEKKVDEIVTTDPKIAIEWGLQRKYFEESLARLAQLQDYTMKHASLENEILVSDCGNLGDMLVSEKEKNNRLKTTMPRMKLIKKEK